MQFIPNLGQLRAVRAAGVETLDMGFRPNRGNNSYLPATIGAARGVGVGDRLDAGAGQKWLARTDIAFLVGSIIAQFSDKIAPYMPEFASKLGSSVSSRVGACVPAVLADSQLAKWGAGFLLSPSKTAIVGAIELAKRAFKEFSSLNGSMAKSDMAKKVGIGAALAFATYSLVYNIHRLHGRPFFSAEMGAARGLNWAGGIPERAREGRGAYERWERGERFYERIMRNYDQLVVTSEAIANEPLGDDHDTHVAQLQALFALKRGGMNAQGVDDPQGILNALGQRLGEVERNRLGILPPQGDSADYGVSTLCDALNDSEDFAGQQIAAVNLVLDADYSHDAENGQERSRAEQAALRRQDLANLLPIGELRRAAPYRLTNLYNRAVVGVFGQ